MSKYNSLAFIFFTLLAATAQALDYTQTSDLDNLTPQSSTPAYEINLLKNQEIQTSTSKNLYGALNIIGNNKTVTGKRLENATLFNYTGVGSNASLSLTGISAAGKNGVLTLTHPSALAGAVIKTTNVDVSLTAVNVKNNRNSQWSATSFLNVQKGDYSSRNVNYTGNTYLSPYKIMTVAPNTVELPAMPGTILGGVINFGAQGDTLSFKGKNTFSTNKINAITPNTHSYTESPKSAVTGKNGQSIEGGILAAYSQLASHASAYFGDFSSIAAAGKTDGTFFTKNTVISGTGASLVHRVVPNTSLYAMTTGNGGNITGGAVLLQRMDAYFKGATSFDGNTITAGTGGSLNVWGESKNYVTGGGGNIIGGLLALVDTNTSGTSYANDIFTVKSNKVTAGNAGSATIASGNVTLGTGGDITGGLLASFGNSSTNTLSFSNLVLDKNTVTGGAAGALKLSNKAGTGTINVGASGMVEGGLMVLSNTQMTASNAKITANKVITGKAVNISANNAAITVSNAGSIRGGIAALEDSALLFSGNSNMSGNTMTVNASGNVTSSSRDVTSGGITYIYGGLFALDASSLTFGGTSNFDKTLITVGGSGAAKTGNANATSGASALFSGGLFSVFDNASLTFNGASSFKNIKVNIKGPGAATSTKNATVGNRKNINGGLFEIDDSSTLKFSGDVVFDKYALTVAKTGNAKSGSGSAIGGAKGTYSGNVLITSASGSITGGLMNFEGSTGIFGGKTLITNAAVKQGNTGSTTSTAGGIATAADAGDIWGGLFFAHNSSVNFNNLLMITGTKITGGNGGSAKTSHSGKVATAGRGSAIYGGLFYTQASTLSFNGDVLISGNTITGGSSGATSSEMTGTKGGDVYGGVLYASTGSDIIFKGQNIIIMNNKVTSGKGGKGRITTGASGNYGAAALYLGSDAKVTFGNGSIRQNILISGNKANGENNAIVMAGTSQLTFNLSPTSLAIINDSIYATENTVLTKKGSGSMYVSGNQSLFGGNLVVEDGIFGVRHDGKTRGVFGNWTNTNITVKSGAYLGVQLDCKKLGAAQIQAKSYTFESGARLLPMGVLLQPKGTTYTYYGAIIQKSTPTLPSGLTSYVNTANATVSLPYVGSGSSANYFSFYLNVKRNKDFSEAISGFDKWVDTYIKTLDVNTLALFDRVFLEGQAATDQTTLNYLRTAVASVKADKKKKLLSQASATKTGITQLEGLLKSYAVGKATIPNPYMTLSSSDTGSWFSSGVNNLRQEGRVNQIPYVAFGHSIPVNMHTRLGVAFQTYDGATNYEQSEIGYDTLKGGSIAFYGSYKPSNNYISFSSIYDLSHHASADTGYLAGSVKDNYRTTSYKVSTEMGREFSFADSVLSPYTGLAYASYERGKYAEKSTASNGRHFDAMKWETMEIPVGLRFAHSVLFGKIKSTLFADAGYAYNFGDDTVSTKAAVYGNGYSYTWDMASEKLGRSRAHFNSGITLEVSEKSSVKLNYEVESTKQATDQRAYLGYNLAF
ncbi:MAG: autotransporter domain-containing protein [Lactobacillales bacterium]|jgi:hypothetical protein|nr:autotransporter domain-containing protein [Lactobacillales bacterium]